MQVVNLIFLLGSRASQLRKVLAPRSPALHPRGAPARPPAHPPEATSCARTARQEALLPYFDSPADLLAADKAMHKGDLAKYGEMVTPGTRRADRSERAASRGCLAWPHRWRPC